MDLSLLTSRDPAVGSGMRGWSARTIRRGLSESGWAARTGFEGLSSLVKPFAG